MGEKETRKERDRRRRESDFLNSAERLFAQQGYHTTSMEDIARDAEYATGTIYRYFPSKEELYHEIILRKGSGFFQHMFDAIEAVEQPLERLRMLIRGKLEFFSEHREFLKIFVNEISGCRLSSAEETLPEEMRKLKSRYLEQLRGAFRDGMERGDFRRLNIDMVMAAVTGLTNELLADWVQNEQAGEPGELEDFVIGFIADGICMKEGMER